MNMPGAPTKQFPLTIIARVIPERLEELRLTLDKIRRQTIEQMQGVASSESPLAPFAELKTVHYARWVLIEPYARFGSGPLLVFSTNYDGPEGRHSTRAEAEAIHLSEIVAKLRRGLDAVYSACEGYPGASASDDAVLGYLSRSEHLYQPAAFYVGSSGRSCPQILSEATLRRRINEALDEEDAAGEAAAQGPALVAKLRNKLGAPPAFPAQPDLKMNVDVLVFVLALGVLVTSPVSIPALLVSALILRTKEQTDPELAPEYSPEERGHVARASRDENLFLQNQITHIVDLKPGPFRAALIRVVFWGIQFLAVNLFNQGKLGNIPSIHFARWVLIDEGRRVLFFSNFDSSWESYLGDFVDQASNGLTAVWSNTVGYPRSKWLLFAGSRAADRFKAWTRHCQIPTQVWYSAYPGVSIVNINDNTLIRRGLAEATPVFPEQWLPKVT